MGAQSTTRRATFNNGVINMLCITIKDNAEFYVDQASIILKRDGKRTKVLIDAPPLVKIRRAELPERAGEGRKATA